MNTASRTISRDPKGRFPAKTNAQIFADAKSCKTLKEFREKFVGSEQLARRRGLMSQMPWLRRAKVPDGYWTYQRCIEESRKYTGMGRSAFEHNSPVAYQASLSHGWLDDMPWLGVALDPTKDGMYFVYAYKFEAQHAAYVGLTMDRSRRDRDHRSGECKSAVFRFANDIGVDIPDMTILAAGLLATEAQHLEGVWVDRLKNEGWHLLNTGRVGDVVSSLGSIVRKWSAKRAIEESKKYKTRTEFSTSCSKAYSYVARHNLWHLMPWLPNRGNGTSFVMGMKPSSRRIDEEEFLRTFRENNPHADSIEIVGEYKSAKSKIAVRCKECGHEWNANPRVLMKGFGCRLCGYKRAAETKRKSPPKLMSRTGKSFAQVYPLLANQWHPTRNGCLTPSDVSPQSNKKVWWRCSHGHEWKAIVFKMTRAKQGCPYCSNRQVQSGFNDLAHLFPLLMTEWDYEKNVDNPAKMLPRSDVKVWWRCPVGHNYMMSVKKRTRGKMCPICARVHGHPLAVDR